MERPVVRINLVKALIIKHRYKRGIGRCTVGLRNLQAPLLLLTRCQAVAEGLPRQLQMLFRQRTRDGLLVDMAFTVLDPCIGQQQTVAIFFLILQLTVNQLAVLPDAAALQHLVTCKQRINDMQVRIAGAHLNGYGFSIIRELGLGDIEPVGSLRSRLLIVKAKHNKFHVHLVVAAFCLNTVFATL